MSVYAFPALEHSISHRTTPKPTGSRFSITRTSEVIRAETLPSARLRVAVDLSSARKTAVSAVRATVNSAGGWETASEACPLVAARTHRTPATPTARMRMRSLLGTCRSAGSHPRHGGSPCRAWSPSAAGGARPAGDPARCGPFVSGAPRGGPGTPRGLRPGRLARPGRPAGRYRLWRPRDLGVAPGSAEGRPGGFAMRVG